MENELLFHNEANVYDKSVLNAIPIDMYIETKDKQKVVSVQAHESIDQMDVLRQALNESIGWRQTNGKHKLYTYYVTTRFIGSSELRDKYFVWIFCSS